MRIFKKNLEINKLRGASYQISNLSTWWIIFNQHLEEKNQILIISINNSKTVEIFVLIISLIENNNINI